MDAEIDKFKLHPVELQDQNQMLVRAQTVDAKKGNKAEPPVKTAKRDKLADPNETVPIERRQFVTNIMVSNLNRLSSISG